MLDGELDVPGWLVEFMKEERLPASFVDKALRYCLPLSSRINTERESIGGTCFVGLNGGQGTGKSTIGALVALMLRELQGLNTAVVSLDDLYLTKSEREELADTVHPLFMTRGVPGTHDVEMGLSLFEQVKLGKEVKFPVFDKAIDDRSPDETIVVPAKTDVLIFEGWCVGAEKEQNIQNALNDFEAEHDELGIWRQYVNEQLGGSYQKLFSYLDMLVMLKAPSFECIYRWRGLQEKKLAERVKREGGDDSGVMSEQALIYFISHYERLTRHMLAEMPNRAEVVLKLAEDHSVSAAKGIL